MNKNRGIIVLDPGHGQFGNKHTTRDGFYEGTQNYILASFLKAELEAIGFDVRMTRERVEDDMGLVERGAMAGNLGAVMFLSIHSNAPGGNPGEDRYAKIRGAETFYSVSDCEGNAPIARDLTDAVVRTMQTEDRGIKTRRYPDNESVDYYGVLRSAAASGCKRAFLIEHGFHTNPEDSAFLQNSDCLAKLAKAEAEVIDKWF
ncbi:MAG: N-acetylmuramoyl-L-alanine amidase [Clostridia bacterium]|nr:N-acetylmuramoyl-L-alanine amidase [Clostridia bacterium]